MPYWSIGEWRARIGSSWCALGRPFKKRSPFRGKTPQRAIALSQGVATLFLLLMSIGVNLGLRTLVASGHHLPLLSEWFELSLWPFASHRLKISCRDAQRQYLTQ